MDISDYRKKIDEIDEKLVDLFKRRMDVAANIGAYKRERNLPVYDPARERAKLHEIAQMSGTEYENYAESLYSMIFELSRAHQRKLSGAKCALHEKITGALSSTPQLFPERQLVACQGVEGAYSQRACEKLFKNSNIMYFSSFEGVFAAIDKGLCRYGVLPLENSSAGSVNRVYDLMMKYDFSIVRSTRVKVDHCLLASEGTEISGIKEIVSHEQAIAQCEEFIKSLGNIKVTPVANTAVAAQMVSASGRSDLAALSSVACAELYGLSVLKSAVQDSASNYTRFICISKNLEIYPGADKTSIMMVLPHRPGSLYNALGRFYALGINLIKLESRPIAGSDFEFMFYFDLDTSVYSERFTSIFDDLEGMCTSLTYLGSYSEVV